MAKGVVSINQYDQRSTPRSANQPYVRALDAGSGIAPGLAQLGRGLETVAQADQEIERLRIAREEDDARVYVSSAMARARAEASRIRRTALQEAPDGWRGVTDRVSKEWGQLRETALQAAPTPSASRFLSQAFDSYQPLLLEDVAGDEQNARQQWRVDTVRTAIQTEGSTLAADPSLYDQAVSQQRELIRGMADLDANQRRDLEALMEEEFATVTVSGLVQRDPAGTLRMLNDPEADGPFARLTGSQRRALANQAQAELDRRAAQWRAQVDDRMRGALALLEAGEQPLDAPTVEEVRAARGESAAAAYQIEMETFQAGSEMNGMSNAELSRLAASPALDEGSETERYENAVRRRAATNILRLRALDPMAYAVQQGVVTNTDEMIAAIDSGDVGQIGALLRRRVGVAVEQRERLGPEIPASPLTVQEAQRLRGLLDGLTPETRLAALTALRAGASMPRRGDQGVYAAMLSQVYADNPGAFAGAAALTRHAAVQTASGPVTGATAARRLMAGAAILNPPATDTNDNGRPERQRSTFNMPSNAALEGAFLSYVGDAYADDPEGYHRAFQAFRAYYAGAAAELGGDLSNLTFSYGAVGGDTQAVALAEEAAVVAVGHLRANESGGRPGLPTQTYLPWGMTDDQFHRSLEQGWGSIRSRYDQAELSDDPRDYDYARGRDGFYTVFYRGVPVPDGEGGFVRVRPRLYDR